MTTPIPTNQARMSTNDIVAATTGTLRSVGTLGGEITGITSDSRAATPGCAFVALHGDSHDGHAFAVAAVARGASLVIAQAGRPMPDLEGATVIEVRDTLEAWGALGRAHLRAWRSAPGGAATAKRAVAITGSAGKTTTKELCARILASLGPCHATPGNLNNRVGVPAVAFSVEASDVFAVFEIGMSVPGEIAALARVLEPDVAVLLNVGLAHAGGVGGTRDDVAREKGAIFEQLGSSACAVASADDSAVLAQLTRTHATRIVTFGRADGAQYRLLERTPLADRGSRVEIEVPRPRRRERIVLELPLPGEAAAIDLLAALAAAEAATESAMTPALLAAAVSGIGSISGRAAIRRLEGDILVLYDSYNANPASMRAALETLTEIANASGRRTVAILGEMKELGPLGEAEHERLGSEIAERKISLVIGCGGLIDLTLDQAAKAGTSVAKADSTLGAAELALEAVRAGDAVLLKGSRAAGVERIWDALAKKHGAERSAEDREEHR